MSWSVDLVGVHLSTFRWCSRGCNFVGNRNICQVEDHRCEVEWLFRGDSVKKLISLQKNTKIATTPHPAGLSLLRAYSVSAKMDYFVAVVLLWVCHHTARPIILVVDRKVVATTLLCNQLSITCAFASAAPLAKHETVLHAGYVFPIAGL